MSLRVVDRGLQIIRHDCQFLQFRNGRPINLLDPLVRWIWIDVLLYCVAERPFQISSLPCACRPMIKAPRARNRISARGVHAIGREVLPTGIVAWDKVPAPCEIENMAARACDRRGSRCELAFI